MKFSSIVNHMGTIIETHEDTEKLYEEAEEAELGDGIDG